MKYEDLKDTFTFKTQDGKSALTYTADKKSKHIWTVSIVYTGVSADWDCEDMLEHFNSGYWVIQDEDQLEETREVKLQEQAQEVTEVKTLRDEFAMAALTGLLTTRHPDYHGQDGFEVVSNDAYLLADAMMQARKEQE